MDHLYQTTMLLPASYAVISEEEMTYLDGGKEILLGSVFGYDITFNTDQFVIFCQSPQLFQKYYCQRSQQWSVPGWHLLPHLG